ncbi:MAG TPA: DUF883 family protein [Acidiferrobacter sp.]|nr:DUF883 family protein [Acidiferrobacter sp.]
MDKTEGFSTILNQLFTDLKALMADGEKLMEATAHEGGETITALRTAMSKHLADVKVRLSEAEATASQKTKAATKAATKATEEYIFANPWQSLLAVGGLAALAGYLVGRTRPPE